MAENIWSALSNQLAEAAAATGKSVVAVHGRRHPSSGILWSGDSVVTANHALRRDEEISVVTAPGKSISARVIGRDPSTDVAVLRLQQPAEATLARWVDTSKLRIGELVLALGRSWRGNIVASSGIVSGLMGPWRTWRGGELEQFIRPDLTMYPGFSGGPLVNAQGEILGVNTAGLHRSGITVPAATIARVAAELLEKGRIERPYLGLAMQAVPLPESLRARLNLKPSDGLLVAHVEPGSPAEKGGVILGDVLIEIEGKTVADTDAVQETLRSQKAGDSIAVRVVRGGALVAITLTLTARP
ncbi:MAG TPA: trypsin-like peptidase domain-containing protein [Candidatus Angelobacter sp.]|nr:trypsin-like peptidase domain-containing protein [Candidatus Angelobacter sp.]